MKKKITDRNRDKCIATQELNKSASKNLAARLAQANLGSKNDIANFDDKLIN